MSASTIELPRPEQVVAGRYRLLERLGSGGMGLVFLAEHVGVGNRVAVKFLDPEPNEDPHRVTRFLREAKVNLEVRHPGAAQLLDVGRDEVGHLYLVFEYVEGRDLRDLLKAEGRLRFDEAKAIALKVAEVLAFAHERHIVHRDVKPENIRVRRDLTGPHVKVLDFGIARLLRAGGIRLTAAGTLAGTPRYMAPEQVRDVELDGRTDGYALGLVFFEMLTGAPAFSGKSVTQVLFQQVHEPLQPLRQVARDVDEDDASVVDAFLARACAKEPDERFPTMADFVAALGAMPVSVARWPGPRLPPPVSLVPANAPPLHRGAGLSDTIVRGPGGKTELEAPRSPPSSTLPSPPARASARRLENRPPEGASHAAKTVEDGLVAPRPPWRVTTLVLGLLLVILVGGLALAAWWWGLALP